MVAASFDGDINRMDSGSTILLVDDSVDDVFLFNHYVAKNHLPFKIQVAHDGTEGMNYMEGKGEFGDREKFPIPNFIISDNNMPGMTGKEFVTWLKADSRYASVPTVFFSGTTSSTDVDHAYGKLGVQSYIFKPEEPKKLEHYIKVIFDYWSICAVPQCKVD
ncbi:MAG: two-component system response regulator [Verrucomicrobiales bacterium]|nr:two-component system response regulator [Verrucomicrobiales bacterium]